MLANMSIFKRSTKKVKKCHFQTSIPVCTTVHTSTFLASGLAAPFLQAPPHSSALLSLGSSCYIDNSHCGCLWQYRIQVTSLSSHYVYTTRDNIAASAAIVCKDASVLLYINYYLLTYMYSTVERPGKPEIEKIGKSTCFLLNRRPPYIIHT